MIARFKARLEMLPPAQQHLWPQLNLTAALGFVLYGGTAIALRAAAREIFGPSFQPSEGLKALVYFGDGDLRTLTAADKDALIKAASAVRELPAIAILSRQLVA